MVRKSPSQKLSKIHWPENGAGQGRQPNKRCLCTLQEKDP